MPTIAARTRSTLKPLVRRYGAFVGSIVRVATEAPHIVVTYDDGPEPGGTDRVLASLAKHEASATFFILLSRARRYRSLVEDVVSAGHEIALHGLDHRRLTAFSASEVRRRTSDAKAELEDLSGRGIHWFRPPYGAQSLGTWRATRSVGLAPVLWGPTTWDWKDIPQSERVDSALRGAAPGAILLAHDGQASTDDGAFDGPPPHLDRGELADLVLDAYAARGLTGRSLGDALAVGTPVREARFSR
ncbi:MAG: hypothetical protein QOF36_1814 [Microbacteriaceae bacterium]|jgi:peptidoglycan/xylan/chitin deacetylase (PgdA/CDA1 family)|nr:hypothetical protein [Microbacteriaceae bacterium]MDQ1608848.1 hypothetical protein [Microbacteriaceae bacterium]